MRKSFLIILTLCTACSTSSKFQENGHNYVDLGLSVKWSTCNLGAATQEAYGDYYAWGETDFYYIDQEPFTWKFDNTAGYYWSNYSPALRQKYDNLTIPTLQREDDAASVNWGGSWRIPTRNEFYELQNPDKCTWKWITVNGVPGYRITSKVPGHKGNSIFLPAAGILSFTHYEEVDQSGFYWSSSIDTTHSAAALILYFGEEKYQDARARIYGLPIRPVCE